MAPCCSLVGIAVFILLTVLMPLTITSCCTVRRVQRDGLHLCINAVGRKNLRHAGELWDGVAGNRLLHRGQQLLRFLCMAGLKLAGIPIFLDYNLQPALLDAETMGAPTDGEYSHCDTLWLFCSQSDTKPSRPVHFRGCALMIAEPCSCIKSLPTPPGKTTTLHDNDARLGCHKHRWMCSMPAPWQQPRPCCTWLARVMQAITSVPTYVTHLQLGACNVASLHAAIHAEILRNCTRCTACIEHSFTWRIRTQMAAQKKVQLSNTKHMVVPSLDTTAPPRADPRATVTDQAKVSRVVATCSCLLGTSRGSSARLAGS